MKISTYINRKQLLLEAQGVVTKLVPDNQIDDTIKQLPLSTNTDASACPYCKIYDTLNCKECPMYDANNECNKGNSTYRQVTKELRNKTTYRNICDVPGLNALIEQYNLELEG